MAIGQPDSVLIEGERCPSSERDGISKETPNLSSEAREASSDPAGLPPVAFGREQAIGESYPERLIRDAIEAGEFDELPGVGKPIPGRGTTDDDLWWVRGWLSRNRAQDQESSNSE